MAKTVDWTFNISDYGELSRYEGENATVLAIKNILLSSPGNYIGTPSLGLNLEKYQFELLDSVTINKIKSELNSQISKYIESLDNVSISIDKIENDGHTYLGISVSANTGSDDLTANFLVVREENELNIYNEIF